jgi:hypothetical protein
MTGVPVPENVGPIAILLKNIIDYGKMAEKAMA